MGTVQSASITSSPITRPRRVLAVSANGDADRTVVRLRGEYDLTTRAALQDALDRAIAHGDGDLVVDLSQVRFLDAGSVGIILQAREALRTRSCSLTLRSPRGITRRIFELCDLTHLIDDGPSHATSTSRTNGRRGP
ncbi:MAG TPA: STAS domain-containing protein [Acidimicrobiales bacterium]